jgi:hypothetical protein
MGLNLSKLIAWSGPALCDESPRLDELLVIVLEDLGKELLEVLKQKNGFYAFESALHVFPAACQDKAMNLELWNCENSWRKEYGDITNGFVFFAEDIFGLQFALNKGGVYKFDPETAEIGHITNDLEQWASLILKDYEYETGYPLAHKWQKENGILPPGKRLLPKIPFILGGNYEVDNLYPLDALKGMEFRADIWKQIRDLPDGAKIELKIIQ